MLIIGYVVLNGFDWVIICFKSRGDNILPASEDSHSKNIDKVSVVMGFK
jgi:hypothetical protein